MRRWNGWGEEQTTYPLPVSARAYLNSVVGEGAHPSDASKEAALSSLQPVHSVLSIHPHRLITTSAEERLRHARGQSLPDWVTMHTGLIDSAPDGVAYPLNNQDVCDLLDYAAQMEMRVIPYGGGTSVVGHINPPAGDEPVLTIDLSHMDQLLDLDETNYLATFQAGICGPRLEQALKLRGYTLGHFPQSFELSTLGGWIATRSSGQQSYYYGRIEDLFAGGHLETPLGPLDMPTFPASAAGPDMRQLVLGSEGRLGVITTATVRIRPLPEFETFYGVFFRDWQSGIAALREIAQEKTCVSMLRLSDADETQTTLILSGKDDLVTWADHGLNALGYKMGRALLVFGVTGEAKSAHAARRRVVAIVRTHHGLYTGTTIGKLWRKSRFLTPYLRNTLWEHGYALDTLETVLAWSKIPNAADAIKGALRSGLVSIGERVLVFAHLSHVYRDGASLYVTYLFRRSTDPQDTIQRWLTLKNSATQSILRHGGTISHQHGVGIDHAQYLPAEKGLLGMKILDAVANAVDPQRIMNPGKLIR
jgi:alkyldihydroxyacetonephosphate synthase